MGCVPDRALADLGTAAGKKDLGSAEKWGEDRTVRGEVIAALLLGARRPGRGRVPAVRLSSARIVGPIDVSDGDVTASLELTGYLRMTCLTDALPGAVRPWAPLVPGHVIVSYVPCPCRADEGIRGHTVVWCTTDGCRSAVGRLLRL